MQIKKGDTVVVITGKDKNKKGKVLHAIPKKNRVVVENVNVVTKHQKPTQRNQSGGIIKLESPIHVSNVMIYDDKSGKGTRIKYQINKNGKKERVSVKSNSVIADNYKKGGK